MQWIGIWAEKPYDQYDQNGYEDNADAHIKGREAVVAITDGQLDFGPWEQIIYGEFDVTAAKGCWLP